MIRFKKINRDLKLVHVGRRGPKGEKGDPGDVVNAPVQSVNGRIGNVVGLAEQSSLDAGLALKANTADLAEVAFSGSYDDLLDKPATVGPGGSVNNVQLNDGSGGFTGSNNLTHDDLIGLVSVPGFTASDGLGNYAQAGQIYDDGLGNIFQSVGGNGTVPTYLNVGTGGGIYSNNLKVDYNLQNLTDNHTYTFPDKDGTLAMLDDIGVGGVSSVNGRTGDVVGLAEDADLDAEVARAIAAEALKAPLNSPSLTGVPTAPTASQGNNSGQIASTAYVDTAIASVEGSDVDSFNGRTGTVVPVAGDYTATLVTNTPAGGISATTVQAAVNELDTEKAPLASPVFTGNPTAPTPTAGDNDTSIATTAFVQGELSKDNIFITVGDSGSDFNTSSYSGNIAATLQAAINSVPVDTYATIWVRPLTTYDWTGGTALSFGRRKIKLYSYKARFIANYNYTRPIFVQDSTIGLGDIEIAGISFDATLRPNMGYIHMYQADNVWIHDCEFIGQRSLIVDPIIASRSNWSVRLGTYVQTNAACLATDVDTTNDQIDIEKDFSTGTEFTISSTGTLPSPLTTGTSYYAIRINSLIIKVATSSANATAGTAIDLTTQGTGQLTLTPAFNPSDVNTTTDALAVNTPTSVGTGTQLSLSTSGTLPAPLVAGTDYFVIRVSSTSLKLATTQANAFAGTAIDLTDTGSGIFNYQLYNGQSRNVRFYNNVMRNSDAGTNEQLLFVNQRNGYVQNNIWRQNANQLAYEVICYINNYNVDISGNIFEEGDAHAIATMESQDINIHDNQYRSSKNFKFATVINSMNVNIVDNIAKTTNVSHSNGFIHIFDRVAGPDGFAHIVNGSTNINIEDNTVDGFNYGLYAQTLDSTYTMTFDEISLANNKMRNIRTNAVALGVNLSNNLLGRVYIRNNNIYSWLGTSTGAVTVRGYDTIPAQVNKIYIEGNYCAPSSGSGDSSFMRMIGCNTKLVRSNSIIGTGQGTYKPIELVNSATIDTTRGNDGYDNDEYINYGGF